MVSRLDSMLLLDSLSSPNANISEVSEFVLRVICNRPKREKTLGQARYNMLFVKQKGKKRKYASTKALPPDATSLALHIQRVNYITMTSVDCLNPYYTPPQATNYGWEEDSNGCLKPIWSLGPPFPETRETLSAENSLPSSSDKQKDDGSTDDINSGSEDEDDTSIESAEEDESDCLESGDDSSLSEQEN